MGQKQQYHSFAETEQHRYVHCNMEIEQSVRANKNKFCKYAPFLFLLRSIENGNFVKYHILAKIINLYNISSFWLLLSKYMRMASIIQTELKY